MVLGELNWYMHKNETRLTTHTIQQNKLKMDKRLNRSCDTIKVLGENIGRKILDVPCSNIFTDMSPRAWDIKERINKWDYIKINVIFIVFFPLPFISLIPLFPPAITTLLSTSMSPLSFLLNPSTP